MPLEVDYVKSNPGWTSGSSILLIQFNLIALQKNDVNLNVPLVQKRVFTDTILYFHCIVFVNNSYLYCMTILYIIYHKYWNKNAKPAYICDYVILFF